MAANPWERQRKESIKAFEAFVIYRDMEVERSLAKVAEKCGKSQSLIERWSRQHGWVARVAAWVDEQDRLTREAMLKDIAIMRKNHAGIAKAMLIKAAEALKKLPADEMTMQDIARAVNVAAKLERLSRGN